jgi:hypothetical protein
LYLAKLDEEANYFTVPEEVEDDICACPSCTVSDHNLCLQVLTSLGSRIPMKCCMKDT